MAYYKCMNSGGSVQPTLITKNITANGTYNAADDNADGYSQVVANVTSSPDWYMYDGKVGQASPQEYISSPLLKRMTAGRYVVALNDVENGLYYSTTFIYSGGSVIVRNILRNDRSSNFSGQLTITPTTAGLSEYSGNYRDIYCRIAKIDDSLIYP